MVGEKEDHCQGLLPGVCVCDGDRQGRQTGDGGTRCLLLCEVTETVGSERPVDVRDNMSVFFLVAEGWNCG